MSHQLRRFQADMERLEDQRKLARILIETGEAAPIKVRHATAGGDGQRLRGLPAQRPRHLRGDRRNRSGPGSAH